jgi:lysophospholipase L1-like esterase
MAVTGPRMTPVVDGSRRHVRRAPDVLSFPGSAAEFDDLRDPTACTVRYSRVDREPGLRVYPNPGALDEQVVAALLGCEPERLAEIRSALGSVLNLACDELFANGGFEQSVRSLPFAPGDVVVAVGDSITADALSWAELLGASLRRVGQVDWALINAAISSTTSSDLIANFESIVSKNPSHVIAMIGTNDARRHGRGAKARMTSPTETARNLRLYGEMVRSQSRARLILMTPPPIHEERALRHTAFAVGNVSWRFSEVVQVAEIVRRQRGSVVDIHRAFLGPNLSTYLTADGIHPSVAGQKRIVTVLVDALTHDFHDP